jgi:hypothetical protein
LVFLDRAFTSPYLNKLYNEHFDSAQLGRRYRRTITFEDLDQTPQLVGGQVLKGRLSHEPSGGRLPAERWVCCVGLREAHR